MAFRFGFPLLAHFALGLVRAAAEFPGQEVEFPDPADHMVDPLEAQVGANFKLSATLGDHMVLQRAPASAVVWGFAPAGTVVTTTFDGKKYESTAGNDTVWRTRLVPTPAGGPYTLSFVASTGETATLSDVLFGDVYVCGGQSNMQFSIAGNQNSDAYAKEADAYPSIRLFTVGQKTASDKPLLDLQTVEQRWTPASAQAVSNGTFGYFSAVCWFFGKRVYDGLAGKVPIGLVSNNWGGTPVEAWMSPSTSLRCGHASRGHLYNAMIVPYTVGPMAVTGFTWYQGESDLGGDPNLPDQNNNYSCTQTAMIEQWRREFQCPQAFYGVVQLSTWCPAAPGNLLLPQLREQQLASGDVLPNFAYATNADRGAGQNIHPPFKQYPGARLANAAMSIVYGKPINWRSPTYASSFPTGPGELTVWLHDVTEAGLVLKSPANAHTSGDCVQLNLKAANTCAWAALQFNDSAMSWVNATVTIGTDKSTVVLTAPPPSGSTGIVASSYGWGAIPMLTVYRADMDGEDGQLPVLPWRRPAGKMSEKSWTIVV